MMTACLMAFVTLGGWAAKVSQKIDIQVDGKTRSYWLHVPNNAKSTGAPLVFSLHGTGGSLNDKAPFSSDVADQAGCIVVYPQGETLPFPVFGGNLPGWRSTGAYTEDLDFFKAVIEEVDKSYKVDREHIYCCGFSNGGMMTYTVANQLSDVFAAFASISGFPLNEFHLHTTSARPYPFLHIHGKADDFVKYSLMPSIVDNTVARNGCNPVPVVTTVGGKYRKSTYEATEGSFPYVYYEVDGMGHSPWTANTEDGNSALTMWNFFKQYSLSDERDETLKWRPNLEAEGWKPTSHGWIYAPAGSTLLKFGNTTDSNRTQNVYRSLQLLPGKYKLLLRAEGAEGKKVKLTLKKGVTAVLNDSIPVNEDLQLMFEVAEKMKWGEYVLTVTHSKADGEVHFQGLAIHSVTDEEWNEATSVQAPSSPACNESHGMWTLDGKVATVSQKGIYIIDGRKVIK